MVWLRKIKISWGAVALVTLLPLAAAAQEQGYPFRLSNFTLEFYGGYTPIHPDDLNILATYEESYLQFYYIQRNAYLISLGNNASFERYGDETFRPIKWGLPWGVRVKYELSPTLALSVGIQYLATTQDSRVGLNAFIGTPYGFTYADIYNNSRFTLALKAWLPEAGVFAGWNIGRLLRYEIFVVGGPMFAEIRAESDILRCGLYGPGSLWENSSEMKGTSKSWAGEIGMVFRLRPARLFDLFIETSYAFRTAQEFRGPGKSKTTWIDNPFEGQKTSQAEWEGPWRILQIPTYTAWGEFTERTVTNNISDSRGGIQGNNFVLQFSGFQIKVGFGVRL